MIADIFKSVVCCQCGVCSSTRKLCEKCEVNTLKANGLPGSLVSHIHGLSPVWPGNGGFEFSDLHKKIVELTPKAWAMHIVEKIETRMSQRIYGIAAEMYKDNPEKAPEFLHEIAEQTKTNYNTMEPEWGKDLLDEIINYCKINKK